MLREILRTDDLDASAARLVEAEFLRAVHTRGRFVIALSGGRTPQGLYRALAARSDLPWEKISVFWGDERFVPHDHPDSNYGAARDAFLDALPIPADNIHPWPAPDAAPWGSAFTRDGVPASEQGRSEAEGAEGVPAAASRPLPARGWAHEQAARTYARTLRSVIGEPVVFDLQLLGLGSDAHTASLYPEDAALRATGLTVAARPASVPQPRLSLTASALGSSRTTAFLVSGEEKREAFEATLGGSGGNDRYPARRITALERLIWLTDLS